MKTIQIAGLLILISILWTKASYACSILYFVDTKTGKIYAVNNEDYWYNTKAYIKILPATQSELARLWYGWDDFAQGGINQEGLFFDGAVTPEQAKIDGYTGPNSNLGDELLANCKTVPEALAFLEEKKIALTNAHLLFGDKLGNAVVVEWINGKRQIVERRENFLIATNFSLYPNKQEIQCRRYKAIQDEINRLESQKENITFLQVGNIAAKAVQPPYSVEGKTMGTLYTSFINISDMEFVMIYKLDNEKITRLNLHEEFAKTKKQTIKLR